MYINVNFSGWRELVLHCAMLQDMHFDFIGLQLASIEHLVCKRGCKNAILGSFTTLLFVVVQVICIYVCTISTVVLHCSSSTHFGAQKHGPSL